MHSYSIDGGLIFWVNADVEPQDTQHRRKEIILVVSILNKNKNKE